MCWQKTPSSLKLSYHHNFHHFLINKRLCRKQFLALNQKLISWKKNCYIDDKKIGEFTNKFETLITQAPKIDVLVRQNKRESFFVLVAQVHVSTDKLFSIHHGLEFIFSWSVAWVGVLLFTLKKSRSVLITFSSLQLIGATKEDGISPSIKALQSARLFQLWQKKRDALLYHSHRTHREGAQHSTYRISTHSIQTRWPIALI